MFAQNALLPRCDKDNKGNMSSKSARREFKRDDTRTKKEQRSRLSSAASKHLEWRSRRASVPKMRLSRMEEHMSIKGRQGERLGNPAIFHEYHLPADGRRGLLTVKEVGVTHGGMGERKVVINFLG